MRGECWHQSVQLGARYSVQRELEMGDEPKLFTWNLQPLYFKPVTNLPIARNHHILVSGPTILLSVPSLWYLSYPRISAIKCSSQINILLFGINPGAVGVPYFLRFHPSTFLGFFEY